MKPPPVSRDITFEFDGKSYTATYSVAAKLVTVHSAFGSQTTQCGNSSAAVVARMLFRELLDAAKSRGELKR